MVPRHRPRHVRVGRPGHPAADDPGAVRPGPEEEFEDHRRRAADGDGAADEPAPPGVVRHDGAGAGRGAAGVRRRGRRDRSGRGAVAQVPRAAPPEDDPAPRDEGRAGDHDLRPVGADGPEDQRRRIDRRAARLREDGQGAQGAEADPRRHVAVPGVIPCVHHHPERRPAGRGVRRGADEGAGHPGRQARGRDAAGAVRVPARGAGIAGPEVGAARAVAAGHAEPGQVDHRRAADRRPRGREGDQRVGAADLGVAAPERADRRRAGGGWLGRRGVLGAPRRPAADAGRAAGAQRGGSGRRRRWWAG